MGAEQFGPYYEVVLKWSVTGWPNQANVLHLKPEVDEPLDFDIATTIDNAITDWATAGQGARSSSMTLISVEVRDKHAEDGAVFVFPHSIVGTDGSALLPPGTALVVSLHTGLGGKSGRGRVYLGGFCESVNAAGEIDAPSLSTVLTEFQALVTALNDDGHGLAVVSKFHDKAPRAGALVTPVTTITIDSIWDRQARRGRRH